MHDCRPGEGVIFGDVNELGYIPVSAFVDYLDSSSLIAREKEIVDRDVRGGLECKTYPNEAPCIPCSYLIFSSRRRVIVSRPISNISSISSTPWFLRLDKILNAK